MARRFGGSTRRVMYSYTCPGPRVCRRSCSRPSQPDYRSWPLRWGEYRPWWATPPCSFLRATAMRPRARWRASPGTPRCAEASSTAGSFASGSIPRSTSPPSWSSSYDATGMLRMAPWRAPRLERHPDATHRRRDLDPEAAHRVGSVDPDAGKAQRRLERQLPGEDDSSGVARVGGGLGYPGVNGAIWIRD